MDTSRWDKLTTITAFDTGTPESQDEDFDYNKQLIKHSTHITTPVSLLIQSLVHQLCIMLEKDHSKATNLYRNICEKLYEMKLLDEDYGKGEFEIMRSQYQRALCQLIEITNNPELSLDIHSSWPISPISLPRWSRYFSDFHEESFIAKGGFGSVFKAKNHVDGMDYAIKKIEIHFKNINSISNHLSEVKTLASLSHPNIVSYKSAWIEPLIKYHSNVKFSKESNTKSSTSCFEESSEYLEKDSENSNFEICFEESNKSKMSENNNEIINVSDVVESVENCKIICKLSSVGNNKLLENAQVNLNWATLYIQMSLCDKTLKTWLEERNSQTLNRNFFELDSPHIQEVVDIFTQLTNGLNYIHNRQIIHHDIKPSNIFIEEGCGSIAVQLGDFGLACPQQRVHNMGAFGTCLYAAPEQLEGVCHIKNDIYSVGLVLCELIQLFSTEMEKVESFKKLRDGHIPVDITANCPKLAQMIKKSLEHDVNERIDTAQLLSLLRSLKESKDEKIRILQEENSAKDEEIAKLKQLLSLNKIIY